MSKRPIGVFDSGVGGLTILSQLVKAFPNESFIYYADSKDAPIGDKPFTLLDDLNTRMISFFKRRQVKCLISACNTSSALFSEKLKHALDIPTLHLIEPTVNLAVTNTRNRRITVMATSTTVKSNAYGARRQSNAVSVTQVACPELAGIVEKDDFYAAANQEKALSYLYQALASGSDTIIFGCSHYPYFEPLWQLYSPSYVRFINPAVAIIEDVKAFLGPSESALNKDRITFYVTGDPRPFAAFVKRHFSFESYVIESPFIQAEEILEKEAILAY